MFWLQFFDLFFNHFIDNFFFKHFRVKYIIKVLIIVAFNAKSEERLPKAKKSFVSFRCKLSYSVRQDIGHIITLPFTAV